MLLANILITFPIKYNPVFSNGPKNLPKNPPDCPILWNYIYIYWKCVFLLIFTVTHLFFGFLIFAYIYIYIYTVQA